MELQRRGEIYQYGDLLLVPQPPEGVLLKLYTEWKDTDVYSSIFYGEHMSLTGFLVWFTSLNRSVLAAYVREGDDHRAIGLVWINSTFTLPAGFKRAEVAMGFVRGVKPAIVADIGRMAIEWGFEHRQLDALIGTTPVQNRAAIWFGRKIGFTTVGPVHGMAQWAGNLTDVYIQSIDKDIWRKISPFRDTNETGGEDGRAVAERSQYAELNHATADRN